MKKSLKITLTAIPLMVVAGLAVEAFADGDWSERGQSSWLGRYFQRVDLAPADNPEYVAECGSCHMAYSPGMLPAASWRRVMAGLDDHFGDNAELLDQDIASRIASYLDRNAADRIRKGRSPGIARSLAGEAPLRFTETRYFRAKHHEIPPRLVASNPAIGSFSRCEVCHGGAEKGNYDEHAVRMPGVGYWED